VYNNKGANRRGVCVRTDTICPPFRRQGRTGPLRGDREPLGPMFCIVAPEAVGSNSSSLVLTHPHSSSLILTHPHSSSFVLTRPRSVTLAMDGHPGEEGPGAGLWSRPPGHPVPLGRGGCALPGERGGCMGPSHESRPFVICLVSPAGFPRDCEEDSEETGPPPSVL